MFLFIYKALDRDYNDEDRWLYINKDNLKQNLGGFKGTNTELSYDFAH